MGLTNKTLSREATLSMKAIIWA